MSIVANGRPSQLLLSTCSILKIVAVLQISFLRIQVLTGSSVQKVTVHHHAKFRVEQSSCWRNMALHQFFKDGGRPQSWISYVRVWTTYKEHPVVLFAVENLV